MLSVSKMAANGSDSESSESDLNNEVVKFLKKRKVSEDVLQNIKKQKIDVNAAKNLTEKDFDSLGITIGDRRALQASLTAQSTHDTKVGAIEKLKDFLKTKNQKRKENKSGSAVKKETLKLEIGWRHGRTKDEYRQVKFPQGGGTRLKDFSRSATYDEVLSVCKDLFFPEGVNKRKGLSLKDLDVFLGNYSGDPVLLIDGEAFSVNKYRNHASVSKGNTPRVYLMTSGKPKERDEEASKTVKGKETSACVTFASSTKKLVDQSPESKEMLEDFVHDALIEIESENTVDELFAYSPFEDPAALLDLHVGEIKGDTSLEVIPLSQWNIERREVIEQQNQEYSNALKADQQKDKEKEAAREIELLRREREAKVPEEPQVEEDHLIVCVRHLHRGIVTRAFRPDSAMQAVYDWVGSLQADPPHFALFAMIGTQSKTLIYPTQSIVPQTMLYMEQTDDPVPSLPTPLLSSTIISEHVTNEVFLEIPEEDSSSDAFTCPAVYHEETVQVTIHRSTVFTDIIKQFKENKSLHDLSLQIAFQVINNRGESERGVGVGVTRDVIAMFWEKFYDALTVGTKVRIPTIRHGYQAEEWEAIAIFLLKGFMQCNYFPISLSRVFIRVVLHGEESVTEEDLLAELLKFVANDEAHTISQCLSGNLPCESEEIMDILSVYDVRQLPNDGNIKEIFTKLAHKEIIQKPHYITERWSAILQPLKENLTDRIVEVYLKLEPTTKKILQILKGEPSGNDERVVFGYLKRFVKGLEGNQLKRFLVFTTGSDLMVCESLGINFVKVDGLGRRPVAHTCGPFLELPTTYQSFPEFREEFSSILALSTWEMDIV